MTPECPKCGKTMVRVVHPRSGESAWICIRCGAGFDDAVKVTRKVLEKGAGR